MLGQFAVMLVLVTTGFAGQAVDFSGDWIRDPGKTMAAEPPSGGASIAVGSSYTKMRILIEKNKVTIRMSSADGRSSTTTEYLVGVAPDQDQRRAKYVAKWGGASLQTRITSRGVTVEMTWFLEDSYLVCQSSDSSGRLRRIYYRRAVVVK